jgi:hypothetical protein
MLRHGRRHRFFRHKKRTSFLASGLFITLVALVIILYPAQPALAYVLVTTSSSSTATDNQSERKTWYDGTRYWSAILNGSNVEFWYSNGSGFSWAQDSSATLSINTDQYSIEANSSNAYIAYKDTSSGNIFASKASSYPGTGFSWGSASTALSGSANSGPTINRDTGGFLWVSAGGLGAITAVKSSAADNITAWGSPATIDSGASVVYTSFGITPLASGNVYITYYLASLGGSSINGKKNTSGTWDVSPTSIDTNGGGTLGFGAAVSSTSANEVYITYVKNGQTTFKRYIDGTGWQTAVVVDSNATNSTPTIMLNTSNTNLYIYWIRSNTVFYSNAASPYTSWAGATSLYSTGTNTNTTAASSDGGSGTTYAIWTNGSANPYSIYASFPNNPPAAPTLTSPSSGGIATTVTPSLQMNATDSDSDTLKYSIFIYNTAAQSGGNCTGASFETANQNSAGTGWNNGTTAYASGATATYTVQSSMTEANSYCWQAQAKDPAGSNVFGALSSASTFSVNLPPAPPTLSQPVNSSSGTSVLTTFNLRTTDGSSDYVNYWIDVCDDATCSTAGHIIRRICQISTGSSLPSSDGKGTCTSSQTGWAAQDAQAGTAYTASPTLSLSQMAVHSYQPVLLTKNTQYWWRAYAIDPGGSNIWSSSSSINTFTTAPTETHIQGSVNIRGNVNL